LISPCNQISQNQAHYVKFNAIESWQAC